MSMVGRLAGRDRLEAFLFLDWFFLPFKTDISLFVFSLSGIMKISRDMLIRAAYVKSVQLMKHNVKAGEIVLA